MTDTKPARPARQPKAPAKAVPGERIAKVLSRAGVASRREAERMIELGEVAVNGHVIDSPALNVLPGDRITVKGAPIAAAEPARLWLYYKPDGLVTSASDEKGRPTIFDALPPELPRVMTIGRLDLTSEGLLLLTNDGELKRRLELPSTGWLRKYRVRVKGNPTDPDLDPLRKGISVEGEAFQPMEVKLDRHQGANAWLTVGLREGKNREIRRAMNAIGLTVNRLIRVSYGPFRLNEMKPGEVEEVRGKVLRDQLGLEVAAHDEAGETAAGRPAKPRRAPGRATDLTPEGGPRKVRTFTSKGAGGPRQRTDAAQTPAAAPGPKPARAPRPATGAALASARPGTPGGGKPARTPRPAQTPSASPRPGTADGPKPARAPRPARATKPSSPRPAGPRPPRKGA